MLFLDTETCGFHGPIVLMQYAYDDGEIILYCPWENTVQDTMDLMEEITNHEGGIVGFNLAFDWFHWCQMYTTLSLIKDKNQILSEALEEYALAEPEARDGYCLKPVKALDLMLHARKGPYQSTMDREDIRIKRVPTVLAYRLVDLLNKSVNFKDIYFARNKKSKARWRVADVADDVGNVNTDFKDIVLKFAPSTSLKVLVKDALAGSPLLPTTGVVTFEDGGVDEAFHPEEIGFAPYALAGVYKVDKHRVRSLHQTGPNNWQGTWPDVIDYHISYWRFNSIGRTYATNDIVFTRALFHYFNAIGGMSIDDDDSVLACMVGAIRWHGYAINIEGIKQLRKESKEQIKSLKDRMNFSSTAVCRRYLLEVMDESERLVLVANTKATTKGVILEEIAKWKDSKVCPACNGEGCIACDAGFITNNDTNGLPKLHPAAIRATEILDARRAQKEVELFDKLLVAGRFHASFNVIGALSSRMSGSDGLNPQGINKEGVIRKQFTLAPKGMVLCGGDFKGFEVTLVDAVYSDPVLHSDLLSGKKIHGIFGQYLFPPMTYEEIVATDGLQGEKDRYKRSKNGVFALIYMGNEHTLHTRVGIPEDVALQAYNGFVARYKIFGQKRQKYFDMFCSMKQPGGIGTQVVWSDPADYIETLYGFKRYFTLENMICKFLFNLAQKPPQEWKTVKIKVQRRDRMQTAAGALQSSLYASAFALQAGNMRAAGNHIIQGTGAQLTKGLQRKLWDIQPSGINHWRVMPMNIHDEVMSPCPPQYIEAQAKVVNDFIKEHSVKVPLIGMDWTSNRENWGSK